MSSVNGSQTVYDGACVCFSQCVPLFPLLFNTPVSSYKLAENPYCCYNTHAIKETEG